MQFPTLFQMYPLGYEKRKLKYCRSVLRFLLRKPLVKNQCQMLIDFLTQHPIWQPLFQQNRHRFHAVIFHYADKKFNATQRVKQIIYTFTTLEKLLGAERCIELVNQGTIPLCQLTEQLTLNLNINNIDFWEGLFSLNFQDGSTQRYYDCTFSLLSEKTLLLTSLQGPKGDNAQEIVRQLTKQLHGMRPMFMLVECYRILANHWQFTLLGTPHKRQVKVKRLKSGKIYFNYDQFWQENEATYHDGYWHIPLHSNQKDLSEIASKKRAMYRRRYELLAQIKQEMSQHL